MVIITLTFNRKLYNCNHIIQGVSDLYNLCFYRYEGLIKENRMHGRGSYKWPNGDNYIGEYHNGLRNGYGEMIYHSKNEHYKGRWQDGLYHGQGQYWYVIQCAICIWLISTRHRSAMLPEQSSSNVGRKLSLNLRVHKRAFNNYVDIFCLF